MRKTFFIITILAFIAINYGMHALPKKLEDNLQRKANDLFDNQINTNSNVEIYSTNYGVIGYEGNFDDSSKNTTFCGMFWPRGSKNRYLFAGGFWFGAMKPSPQTGEMTKYVSMSYNPNSGKHWFTPGRIEDGDSIQKNMKDKYRIYYSTDFDNYTGMPKIKDDGPNWSLWIEDSVKKYQYGTFKHKYVNDINSRNRNHYPYGPMFVSDEDIISTFKDTDLDNYEIYSMTTAESYKKIGFPLRLQMDSKIYTWENEEMKDVVIHCYTIENKSKDTLYNCWFGGVYDPDVGSEANYAKQASNDKTRYFSEDPDLNLYVIWTNTDRGEAGKGFGYMGLSMLESPATDQNGFIRNDKLFFEQKDQIGLISCRNWGIQQDIGGSDFYYEFLSSIKKDDECKPQEVRIMFSTGPFNMKPGDIARVVISYTFAMPAKGGEADGTYEDLTGISGKTNKDINPSLQANSNSLISKIKNTRNKYYQYAQTDFDNNENSGFSIKEVYPNPVNHFFNIDFNLEKAGNVRISINDETGKEAGLLFDGWKEAGNQIQNISIDKNKLSIGVYFIKLQTDNQIKTKKIVIVK